MREFLVTFESILLIISGTGIAVLISGFYYRRATRDLMKVSKHLHEFMALTTKEQQSGGSYSVTVRFDEKTGEPRYDQTVRPEPAVFNFEDQAVSDVEKADDSKDEDDGGTMKPATCSACGTEYDRNKGDRECPNCGELLCICGALVGVKGGEFCPNCEELAASSEAWDGVSREKGWEMDDEPDKNSPGPEDMVDE